MCASAASRVSALTATLAVALAVAIVGAAGLLFAATATAADDAELALGETSSYSARPIASTAARSEPGGGTVVAKVRPRTAWSKAPTRLLVLETARDAQGELWLKLLLPERPNGASGWVDADYVHLKRSSLRIVVRTRARTVSVFRRGRLVRRFGAVVGRAKTPTPQGQFAVLERVRQSNPRGFIGPWALHLTAFSDVLKNYGGGPGRVAIHGRAGASLNDPIGSARSHGCVRVRNSDVKWLARVATAGTPVRVIS